MTSTPQTPRVTIGMPVYNAAAHIRSAIDSLLAQTYSDFELVISDNASTDDTESICRAYVERDHRIRYVRQAVNRGSTWNFNHVFELARGTYFKWAAYDDVCAPSFIERCVLVLDRDPEVVWCHTQSRHIDAHGDLLRPNDTQPISYVETLPDSKAAVGTSRASESPSERFRAVLLGHGGCLDSYGLIRSAALRKTGLFLPIFGSEKVLMAELGLAGKYYEIADVLFFARIHSAAIGNQRTSKLQRQFINPLARGTLDLARWKMLLGYIAAVRRSQISVSERARCYGTLGRYLFQVHKWRSVVVKALTGGGLAGEYPTITTPTRAKACS